MKVCTSAVQNPFGSLYVGYINRFVTFFVNQSHHLQIVLPSTMFSHYRWLFTAIYHFFYSKNYGPITPHLKTEIAPHTVTLGMWIGRC